jgi:hypothetical protein
VLEPPNKVAAWLYQAELDTGRELFFLNEQDELVVNVTLEQSLVLFSMTLHGCISHISISINIVERMVYKVQHMSSDRQGFFAIRLRVFDWVVVFVDYPRFVQIENLNLIAQSFIAHEHVFASKFALVEDSVNFNVIA